MRRVEKFNDGRLWLDETVGSSESDVVPLWGGKDDGNASVRCVDGRPRLNPGRKLDAGRRSPSMWTQALPLIVSNTYKGQQRQSKTKVTDAR
jgi:hypothetical protein